MRRLPLATVLLSLLLTLMPMQAWAEDLNDGVTDQNTQTAVDGGFQWATFESEAAACAAKVIQIAAGNDQLEESITQSIKENMQDYLTIEEQFDFPWQLTAALHYRETSFRKYNPSNRQGVWQLYSLVKNGTHDFPPSDSITSEEFIRQSGIMIEFFRGKINSNLSANRKPITKSSQDAETIKDTLFSYNGRSSKYAANAANYTDPATGQPYDPKTQPYEGSPYVMNKHDSQRAGMPIITKDNGGVDGRDSRWGAFSLYSRLAGTSQSTCDGQGGSVGVSADGFVFPLKITKTELQRGGIDISGSSWNSALQQQVGGRESRTGPWGFCNCHGEVWGGSIKYLAYDLMAEPGTPVLAVRDGTIVSGYPKDGGMGAYLFLQGNDGNYYFYQHMDPRGEPGGEFQPVKGGDKVKAGDVIGYVGHERYIEDNINGSHLHFSASREILDGPLHRDCTKAECDNADTMIDILEVLKESHEGLAE